MRRSLIALVALALTVAACGNDETTETTVAPTTTTTTMATTTTTMATTTTTEDTRPRSPLNGLPVDDAAALNRRVIAVKVDNHPDSRPQSGIQDADAIWEIRVEGSITRFMAFFHHSDSEYLGPTRSGRPSDAKIVRPLEAPLFISGAQGWIQQGIRNLGVEFFVEPDGMFRIPERRAPHNLYSNTVELREFADTREVADSPPPLSWWNFGELPEATVPAESITVSFSSTFDVTWDWNGTQWERSLNGDESLYRVDFDTEPERITADTLVVVFGRFFTDSGGSGSPVPSTDTIGEGRLLVASGGRIVEGTWSRETPEDPFTLTDATGNELLVPAGYPWISLVPDSSSGDVVWE
ncbi:MAG: DUF3048 domain-containing protein [Acidimicrobiia bacterium]